MPQDLSNLNTSILNLLSKSDLIVIAFDYEGKTIYVNERFLKLTGYTQDEVLNKNWFNLFFEPSEVEIISKLFKKLVDTDAYDSFDFHIKTNSGGRIDLNITASVYKSKDGKKIGTIGIATDITARQKAMKLFETADKAYKIKAQQLEDKNKFLEDTTKAMLNVLEDSKALEDSIKNEKTLIEQRVNERTIELREEEAKLLSSINSIPSGFVLLDTQGNVLVTNEKLSQVLKYKEQKWTVDIIQNFFGKSLDFISTLKSCVQNKASYSTKDILLGTSFYDIYIAPIFIKPSSNTIIGVLVLINDITEARIIERSREEFFTIASHELRTPLTAIKGNSQLLLSKFLAEKDTQSREIIQDIYDSSVRLISIVNDFLTASRLEQGKMAFKIVAMNVNEIIHEVIKELNVTVVPKGIYLKYTQLSDNPILIDADYFKVKEILLNLVSNAIAYTQKGGITITVEQIGKKVKVRISDTGDGIPENMQNLLFRKFQQANESLLARNLSKGTGLGLYISKLLVENMGGSVYLESSKIGVGSVFCFEFPASKVS